MTQLSNLDLTAGLDLNLDADLDLIPMPAADELLLTVPLDVRGLRAQTRGLDVPGRIQLAAYFARQARACTEVAAELVGYL